MSDTTDTATAVRTFAGQILHGDDDHRSWLIEAADAFNDGKPMPPPRGKGTSTAAPNSTATTDRNLRIAREDEPGDLLYRSFWEATRTVSHEEARQIASRFVNQHFRNSDCEYPRASIPAQPDRDDDLLLHSYIKQQARKDALAQSTASRDGGAGSGERVRHLKRGTEYEVLHRGVELQIATVRGGTVSDITGQVVRPGTYTLGEGDRLVIFQGADGKLRACEETEFDDGRFERIASPAAPQPSGEREAELRALSDAATAGKWTRLSGGGGIEATANGQRRLVAFFQDYADNELAMALVNAYRSGELIHRSAAPQPAAQPAIREGYSDDVWFWDIVDSFGIKGLQGDEDVGLRMLCRRLVSAESKLFPNFAAASHPTVRPAAVTEEIAKAIFQLGYEDGACGFIGSDANSDLETAKEHGWEHCRSEALALFSEPSGGDEWKTIESAPKDGTEFLAISEENEARTVHWDVFWSAWYDRGTRFFPTHWRPLPAPPSAQNREG